MATRYTGRPRAPSPPGTNLKSPNARTVNGGSNFGLSRFSNGHHRVTPEEDDMFDSDNTYSLVQDSVTRRPQQPTNGGPPYKTRIDRMFGDSEDDKRPNMSRNPGNKFGSVSSNSTTSSSVRGGSLASLYQARKAGATNGAAGANGGRNGTYDAATVEQIKQQFQAQIEAMMLSQVNKQLTVKE